MPKGIRYNDKMQVRWIQRFHNYKKALLRLSEGIAQSQKQKLSMLEEQGLIQAFEFTHELAWNCMKDFLEDRGAQGLYGSKDATKMAFKEGLFEQGEVWMEMIKSRNLTTHTYDEAVVTKIVQAILKDYFPEFLKLQEKLQSLENQALSK